MARYYKGKRIGANAYTQPDKEKISKTQSRIIRIFLIITEPFQAHRPSS